MSRIETAWAAFSDDTGETDIRIKAVFFAAFSQGWLAAIEHLRSPIEAMHAEFQQLKTKPGHNK